MTARRCKRCLGPLLASAKYGICSRNPDCRAVVRRSISRAWRGRRAPFHPACRICGLPLFKTTNRFGICTRNAVCRREYLRLWAERRRREHPDLAAQDRDRDRRNRHARRAAFNANKRDYYRRYSLVLRAAGLRWNHRPIRYPERSRAILARLRHPSSRPFLTDRPARGASRNPPSAVAASPATVFSTPDLTTDRRPAEPRKAIG